MKRLNIKFLLILLVLAVIVPVGVYFRHADQVTETEAMWLRNSEEAQEDGDSREALRQLAKYLRRKPDDLAREQQAAKLAADVFLDETMRTRQDFKTAQFRLQAAARATLSDPETKGQLERRLIDVLVAAGYFSDADDLIKQHLVTSPKDAELTLQAARCAAALKHTGDQDSAEFYLAKLIGFLPNASGPPFFDEDAALDKHDVEAYWTLAVQYRGQQDAVRADRVIEGMVAVNKDLDGDEDQKKLASSAWFYRGKYRGVYQSRSGTEESIKQNRKEARVEIEKALEIDPDNELAALTISMLHFEDGKYEEAKQYLLEVVKSHPKSRYAYIRLAQHSHIDGDLKQAQDHIKKGLVHNASDSELLWFLSSYQLELRDGDGLRKTIEQMIEKGVPRNVVNVLRAVLPICDSDWSNAARLLRNVKPQVVNQGRLRESVLKNLAASYRQTGEFDRELETYKELWNDPVVGGTDDLLLRLVRSMMDQGRMNEAYEQLMPRVRKASRAEDVPIEIRILAKGVQQWRRRNQGHDGPAVEEAVTDVEPVKGKPEDWLGDSGYWRNVYLKTQEFLRKGQDDEAFRFMSESLDINDRHVAQMPAESPEDLQKKKSALAIWSNFYYFYVGKMLERKGLEEGIPEATEALAKLKEKNGDNPRIVIESARILSSKPEKGTREKLRALETRVIKFSEDQQNPVWIQLAAAYIRTGRTGYDDVKRCWQRALVLAPNHKPTLQLSFHYALQTDDEAGMNAVLDKIKESVSEKDPLWKYARAFYIIRSIQEGGRKQSNLEEAIRLVDEAMDVRKNWAVLYELRGQIHEALGDVEAARDDYDNARRRGSSNPRVIARLVELLIKEGKIKDAQIVLDAVGPTFPGLERYRAYLNIAQGGRIDETLRTLDVFVDDDSKDWKRFIEKGELCRQAAQGRKNEAEVKKLHEEAEAAFRAAVRVGRYRPETWLSLMNFLVGTKRNLSDAEAVLRNAESELPDDVARPVMAQGYVNLRDFVQAEHYLVAISDAEPDNLSIKKAMVEYYIRTKQIGRATSEIQNMIAAADTATGKNLGLVMWARRQMAAVLLRSGSHSDFREAVKQVEANQEFSPKSLQDAILKAQILANRTEPRYQREAMKLLEQVYESDPNFLQFEGKMLLARLYYRDASTPPEERWNKVSPLMGLLMNEEVSERGGEKRTRGQKARLLAQFASMLLDRGDVATATAHVRALKAMQPNAPRAIRLVAQMNLAKKDRRGAEKAIEALIPKDTITTQNAPRLLQAAQLFDEQKLDDRAESLFRRLAKEHPTGKFQLAEYLASRGQQKEANEAIAIARTIVEDKTAQSYLAACNIGLMAIRQLGNNATDRQRDEVAGWFKEGREVRGNRPQLLRIRMLEADYAIVTDDQARATKVFRELLARGDLSDSEEGQIANNLAYLLAARGEDLEEAEEYANRAQTLFGPNASVLDTKGIVHFMKGECDKARRSLEEAVSMNAGVPGFAAYVRGDDAMRAQMHYHLALAYKCVGEKGLAREAWETALAHGFRASDAKPLKRELHDELQVWINAPE